MLCICDVERKVQVRRTMGRRRLAAWGHVSDRSDSPLPHDKLEDEVREDLNI
jgi:hypothetical protein